MKQDSQRRPGRFTPDQMSFWGKQSPYTHPPFYLHPQRQPRPRPRSRPPLFPAFTSDGSKKAYTHHLPPGYKFETLTTLPRPWGEVSRTDIEARNTETVSNKAQYCSIVTTNIGPTKLCLAGEVDARKELP